MYKVVVSDKNYETVADYTGCIQLRISDSGTLSAEFHDGSQKIYRMQEGDEVRKTLMTDEEILSTPKLGEWYKDMLDKQKEGAEIPTP